jgi:hypothetical protein
MAARYLANLKINMILSSRQRVDLGRVDTPDPAEERTAATSHRSLGDRQLSRDLMITVAAILGHSSDV